MEKIGLIREKVKNTGLFSLKTVNRFRHRRLNWAPLA